MFIQFNNTNEYYPKTIIDIDTINVIDKIDKDEETGETFVLNKKD